MYESAAQTQVEKYYGKYPGLVLENAPDTGTTHRGELRVEVPGLLEEADPAGEGQQAMQLVAKPCFPAGFFFLPEPGEQVWVEFAAGDINEPIWSGRWYPTDQTPATVAGGQPTPAQKVIRTMSGHVVQLDDTEDDEKIVITHTTGSFLSIDKDGTVIIGNQNGSTVVLNADDESVVIVDEHQNSVRMTGDGISIVNGEGKAAVTLAGDLARVTAKNIALEGSAVSLGKDAGDPTIQVTQSFLAQWNAFLAHTHATAVGPSGPPLPPPPALAPGSGVTTAVLVK